MTKEIHDYTHHVRDNPNAPVDDTFNLYKRVIGRFPLLSHEEEITLATAIKEGKKAQKKLKKTPDRESEPLQLLVEKGQEAMDILLASNTRLVVSIAKRYQGKGLDLQDLIQEGNLGLLKAADKYDHTVGTRFSTYATWWIRLAVSRATMDHGRTIRIPENKYKKISSILRAKELLHQENHDEPTVEEIAAFLESTEGKSFSPAEIRWLIVNSYLPLSLDDALDDGLSERASFVKDNSPQPHHYLDEYEMQNDLALALLSLTPKERFILELRYGLNGNDPHTLDETRIIVGLSVERVRQIQKEVLKKIKLNHPDLQTYLINNNRR